MHILNRISLFFLALLITSSALYGTQEPVPTQPIESKLAFGNKDSDVQVYIFTDWLCPPCRKWEPALEEILPRLLASTKVTYVDIAIHPATREYIPYDLSFALNNKEKYPQIRHVLFDLASNNKNPTDTQITDALKGLQVDYKKVDNSTLSAGTTYFRDLVKKYSVDRAPTIVIVNSKTGQVTTFAGLDKINTAKVLEAVDKKGR